MDILNVTTTAHVDDSLQVDYEVKKWRHYWAAAKVATIVVSVLGLLGNFLSYKAADFLPKSNSSVLMKYLAVWDSGTVAGIGLILSTLDLATTNVLNENVSKVPPPDQLYILDPG